MFVKKLNFGRIGCGVQVTGQDKVVKLAVGQKIKNCFGLSQANGAIRWPVMKMGVEQV
jgi:hypothetical protein